MIMKTIKALASIFIILSIITTNTLPAFGAFDSDMNDNNITFATIVFDGKTMTVPTIAQRNNENVLTTESTIGQTSIQDDSVTYFLPITEEALAYNEALVNGIVGPGTSTETFTEKGYMSITSYIRYTISGGTMNGKYVNDLFCLIDNVAITKDRGPGTIGSPITGIGHPNIRVVCVGGRPEGGNYYGQDVTFEQVPWSINGEDTPSSWRPVVRGAYSDQFRAFATFSVLLFDANVQAYTLEFTHSLAK